MINTGYDSRDQTYEDTITPLSIPIGAWTHMVITHDATLSAMSYWVNGVLFKTYIVPTYDNLDQIIFYGADDFWLREVVVHSGVKYTSPWAFDTQGRYNLMIHEAQSGTINM